MALTAIQTFHPSFQNQTLEILPADTEFRRSQASTLVNQMYSWRGYSSGFTVEDRPEQVTLVATDSETSAAVGTISVALDSTAGLLADEAYREEIDSLRIEGRQLCEMSKFAVDKNMRSKRLVSTLVHVAFIYAYHLQKCTDLLIEVTPQHAVFYRHLLHFEPAGPEKLNPRVNTRGVLLRLNLDHAAEQIRLFGGTGEKSRERSLYPFVLSPQREHEVLERMLTEYHALQAAA